MTDSLLNIPSLPKAPKEEKGEMSSLDIRFLVKELSGQIAGGVFRKIYQYGTKSREFLFEIWLPGRGTAWLYCGKGMMFITTSKRPGPLQPPNFCMFLRKHLNGKKIMTVKQHGFDRIVEIQTAENLLVFELFSKGNVILCDGLGTIVMPLEVQRWSDREERPKMPYKRPRSDMDPLSSGYELFRAVLSKSDRGAAAFLAVHAGLGPLYANEACALAGVNPDKACLSLSSAEVSRLFSAIERMAGSKMRPVVYGDVVSPFPLKVMEGKPFKEVAGFSEALDSFFGVRIEAAEEKKASQKTVQAVEKAERIIAEQEKSLVMLEEKKEEKKVSANLIHRNYTLIYGILQGLKSARESKLSWEEIKKKLSEAKTPEAEAIKELRENEGKVLVKVGGEEVLLDFRKTVDENAADYFEESKKAARKAEGLQEAMEVQKERLEVPAVPEVPAAQEERPAVAEEKPEPVKKPRTRWYEKFRWFRTTNGFMVVAGKDSTQNENLVKKHAELNDLVFHSDVSGSAFVVVKSEGREIVEPALKEASEFAAAHCSSWKAGHGEVDVFCVRPEQVTKNAPSGECVPKGAFIISGQRQWFRKVEIKLAVGVGPDPRTGTARVIAAPVMAARVHSSYFITLKPGTTPAEELAPKIKNSILAKARQEDRFWIGRMPLEAFREAVPYGQGVIVERFL